MDPATMIKVYQLLAKQYEECSFLNKEESKRTIWQIVDELTKLELHESEKMANYYLHQR